ncbi:O-antigen ligase family protein [Massilia sp. PWRC2]|uniref:O-antigen ligase family protein n=1 Tax=Massilia sp. PWRC2 TaxID=2804626 RepID=UPI003CF9D42E
MSHLIADKLSSRYALLALFASLFLLFTPFEQSGPHPTMFPKYFAAGAGMFMLAPLVIIKQMSIRMAAIMISLAVLTILFHTIVIKPVPAQFTLLILANGALALMLYEASYRWRKEFVISVSSLLLINAIFIIVQAVLFYVVTHSIFDFHKALFGSDSRFAEDYLNIARFSGIQVEPGTYANYIGCLTAILLLVAEFSARILWIAFLAVLSIFLTNSGSSVYFVPVLIALMAYLWRSKIRMVHLLVLIVAIFAYLFFSGVLNHLEDRFFEHDDGSLSHRVEGMHAYMTQSIEEKFFGVGFGSDPCVRCYYQDIGVAFNLVTRGGALVTLALVLILARSVAVNGPILAIILFLIPLNEKMFFYEAPIWLFLLLSSTSLRASPMQLSDASASRRPAGIFMQDWGVPNNWWLSS